MTHHIAVIGSGTLARSLCWALAIGTPRGSDDVTELRVSVVARSAVGAAELARSSRVRAAVWRAPVSFDADTLDDPRALFTRMRPDLVVCCASAQSPYERTGAPSAWTDLVGRAGFGVTLPLQAAVVVPLARALADLSPTTVLVNGCFPDAVNPLLAGLDLPVRCGIGNVSTLAAVLQADLGLADQDRLSVLAHHSQLGGPLPDGRDALAWLDGVPVTGVTARLAPERARPRPELNDIAGHAAAALVVALVRGHTGRANVPGPAGLPGGYPVRFGPTGLRLDLPAGLTVDDAIAANRAAAAADGVDVADGHVQPTPAAAEALRPYAPHLATGWPVTALDEVTTQLLDVRRQLRLARPVAV